ncbi:MAG: hypothetical protein ACKV22_08850 [Bryobacteraceae bacterium]
METQSDFWGEIQQSDVRPPVAILREQAALLGAKTNNLIEARVDTSPDINELGETTESFHYSFNLVVPALEFYRYCLFTIRHGIGLYPVKVEYPYKELKTEEEFRDWLRQRLSSSETKRIIGNLLVLVNS